MLSPLLVLTLAAAPVEMTIVHSVPLGLSAQPAKMGTQKRSSYSEKAPKRTASTAFIDAEGKVHLQCEQRDHAHDAESEQ